jgi:hypothetical protein
MLDSQHKYARPKAKPALMVRTNERDRQSKGWQYSALFGFFIIPYGTNALEQKVRMEGKGADTKLTQTSMQVRGMGADVAITKVGSTDVRLITPGGDRG